MAVLALLLLSVPSLALLGVAVRRRAALRAGRARALGESGAPAPAQALVDASRRSSEDVLATLERNVRAIDAGIDAMLVFVPDGEELACAYAGGSRAEHFRRLRLARGELRRLPAQAASAGCRVCLAGGEGLFPNDRAAAAVPVYDGAALRAVVYVSSTDARALRELDAIVRAVQDAATPYAIALEREADRADATYDGLTGALTPRAFRDRLHAEIAAVHRHAGAVASLWFVDTDRFKRINDEFGHRAGDGVLIAMAGLLRSHAVPGVDLVGRNGGDEFCALVRGASKTAAIERAQSFCEAVRAYDFGLPARVTASVGVAAYPYDASSSSELLEAADAAMYHSKRAGRDRVAFALERGRYEVFEAG